MGRIIIIEFDYACEKVVSYIEVLSQMEKGAGMIFTNCLEFFSFATLDKGYNVKVVKANGDYILLSELLNDADGNYTKRRIHTAHNVKKLLLAGEFKFKTVEFKNKEES